MPGMRRLLAGAWAMWEQARGGEGCDLVEAADWGLLFLPWVIERGPPSIVQLHGSVGQINLHDPVRGEEVQGSLIRMLERVGVARATRVQGYSEETPGSGSARPGPGSIASGQPGNRSSRATKPLRERSAASSSAGSSAGRGRRCSAMRFTCWAHGRPSSTGWAGTLRSRPGVPARRITCAGSGRTSGDRS